MCNFINRANLKHNFKYDYSKSIYINAKTKLIIICKDHGEFLQKPDNHLQGNGCHICKNLKTGHRCRNTTEDFIGAANIIHNNKYDYSLVEYEANNKKIKIICLEHGVFEQTPAHHTNRKQGCPKCKAKKTSSRCTMKLKDFINLSNLKHNNKYTYKNTIYINSSKKIEITCKEHGNFYQTPSSHLSGNGCPLCAKNNTGWTLTNFRNACQKNLNTTGILYIIRCFNETEEFYKIGITSRTVKVRFHNKTLMPYSYEIIQEIVDVSDNVWKMEKILHKLYKKYQYTPSTYFAGNLECFKF